jgi:hypothetical protein
MGGAMTVTSHLVAFVSNMIAFLLSFSRTMGTSIQMNRSPHVEEASVKG